MRHGGSLLAVWLSFYAVYVCPPSPSSYLYCNVIVCWFLYSPHGVEDFSSRFQTTSIFFHLRNIIMYTHTVSSSEYKFFETRARMYLKKSRQISVLLSTTSPNLEWKVGTCTTRINGGGGWRRGYFTKGEREVW